MTMVLTILGGVFLVLLLLVAAVVVGWFILKRKLARAFAGVAGGLGPSSITLQPLGTALPSALDERSRAFEQLGFARIDAYRVPELGTVMVSALMHEKESAYAAVYSHEQAGVWSDVVVKYADAGGLTVSNAPMGGTLDPMPGRRKVWDKTADEQGLWELFLREVTPGAPRRPASRETFGPFFCEAYREEMEWRTTRGGATLDEIRRVAEATPGRFDEATIAAAKEVIESDARKKLTESLRLAAAATMDGATWESVEDRVVILHEKMSVEQARDALTEALSHPDVDEATHERLVGALDALVRDGVPPLEWPARLAPSIPASARFTEKVRLQEPVKAVVLVTADV